MQVRAKRSRSSRTGESSGGNSSMSNNSGGSGASPAAVERKEIERKRRQEMRRLCVKLASLLPKEQCSSKDTLSQLGSLDEAAVYIKKLKERVDELQQKRSSAAMTMRGGGGSAGASTSAATTTRGDAMTKEAASADGAVAAPVVEVRQHDDGSILDVVMISSVERPFKMHEVVTVLEEEGAEIINANFSVTGQQIFYTIHCRAFCSRIGIEVARVSERLRALVLAIQELLQPLLTESDGQIWFPVDVQKGQVQRYVTVLAAAQQPVAD